jgi:hypothetical protein
VTLDDVYSADVAITSLLPGTVYELSFRPTSPDDPAFHDWATLSITTKGTSPAPSGGTESEESTNATTDTSSAANHRIITAIATDNVVQIGTPTIVDSNELKPTPTSRADDDEADVRLSDTTLNKHAEKRSAIKPVAFATSALVLFVLLFLVVRRKRHQPSKRGN